MIIGGSILSVYGMSLEYPKPMHEYKINIPIDEYLILVKRSIARCGAMIGARRKPSSPPQKTAKKDMSVKEKSTTWTN